VEELVRLVGENIRQNKSYVTKDVKAIDWIFVTNELNHSKVCKMSHIRVKDKWNNLVKQLPENEDYASESEPIEKNGYVYILNFCDCISCK